MVGNVDNVAGTIIERKQAEEGLQEFFNQSPDMACIVSIDGYFLKINLMWQEVLGYTENEIIATHLLDFIHPEDRGATKIEVEHQLAAKATMRFTNRYRCKNGNYKCLEWRATPDADKKIFFACARDISEPKRMEEEACDLAFYDALTGLPNRRLLHDRLSLTLTKSARSHQHGAVLFINLDKFKKLNDELGHECGDKLLIEVSKRLKSTVRAEDTVARLGGDEFVVLVDNLDTDSESASQKIAQIAQNIRAALVTPYLINECKHHSSPSIGVCLYYGKDDSVNDIIKHAEIAMQQAKDSWQNKVQFFDSHMQKLVEIHTAIESDLRQAIDSQQLQLFYQIQLDHNHQPVGAEALMRWIHPKRGIVSPALFIPIAEESSLILEIGHWLLDTACKQISVWSMNEKMHNFVLAVNISARQFMQPDFVEQVKAVIHKHRIEPQRLKLELTESVALDDIDFLIAKMLALRHVVGVTLSLDDFGTGYSSLSYLNKLPFNQVKIDQSFVCDIKSDACDSVMVKTIIGMAENFNMSVIAEGVETETQLDVLKKNGCLSFQGYLFSKPIPLREFEELLEKTYL